MVEIKQNDLIQSVADALQYISYYHPEDYIANLARAYEMEESAAAKDAMKQILVNSRMCFEGHRPICQDTGIVTAFLKVGMDVRFVAEDGKSSASMSLQEMCDAGVRRAWLDPDNKLRGKHPARIRRIRDRNTVDNTPCVVEVSLVKGSDGWMLRLRRRVGGRRRSRSL